MIRNLVVDEKPQLPHDANTVRTEPTNICRRVLEWMLELERASTMHRGYNLKFVKEMTDADLASLVLLSFDHPLHQRCGAVEYDKIETRLKKDLECRAAPPVRDARIPTFASHLVQESPKLAGRDAVRSALNEARDTIIRGRAREGKDPIALIDKALAGLDEEETAPSGGDAQHVLSLINVVNGLASCYGIGPALSPNEPFSSIMARVRTILHTVSAAATKAVSLDLRGLQVALEGSYRTPRTLGVLTGRELIDLVICRLRAIGEALPRLG